MARVRQVRLLPYRLPLRAPWPGAEAGWRARRGWLLILWAGEQAGYGDCAPLPADGGPAHAAAETWLTAHLGRLRGRSVDELLEDPRLLAEAPPAVACAVETALLDLQARLARRPLRTGIDPGARDRLPVNALAGALDETAGEAARAAGAQGFSVVKFKVGREDPAATLQRLRGLAPRLPPGRRLRLDANRAWRDREAVARLLEGLAGLPVEMVEEPLRAPTVEDLAWLQARVPRPLGLDESLLDLPHDALLEAVPGAWLVLKPSCLGGPRATLALARAGAEGDHPLVVSSALESAAGLCALAEFAACLPTPEPMPAQGLATADWLADDLGDPPVIRHGTLCLGDHPGSGFQPHTSPPEK